MLSVLLPVSQVWAALLPATPLVPGHFLPLSFILTLPSVLAQTHNPPCPRLSFPMGCASCRRSQWGPASDATHSSIFAWYLIFSFDAGLNASPVINALFNCWQQQHRCKTHLWLLNRTLGWPDFPCPLPYWPGFSCKQPPSCQCLNMFLPSHRNVILLKIFMPSLGKHLILLFIFFLLLLLCALVFFLHLCLRTSCTWGLQRLARRGR